MRRRDVIAAAVSSKLQEQETKFDLPDSDVSRKARRIRIQPTRGWTQLGLSELWEYRDLLWVQTLRNVAARYRQMALGPIWIILQPFINMVIFTFIFGTLAKFPSDNVPYPLFTYAAILPWTFFAGACDKSVGSLTSQMNVIAKVYFPRMILPLSAMLAAFVDFLVSFVILVGMMAYFGVSTGSRVVLLPLFLLLAAAAALALGLWTASLAVRFRDVQILAGNVVRAGMFLTPVAYSPTLIAQNTPQWMWLYKLNPMYWVVEGFRWCLLGTGSGPEAYMLIPVGIVGLLLVSGAYVFRRTERTIVDLL